MIAYVWALKCLSKYRLVAGALVMCRRCMFQIISCLLNSFTTSVHQSVCLWPGISDWVIRRFFVKFGQAFIYSELLSKRGFRENWREWNSTPYFPMFVFCLLTGVIRYKRSPHNAVQYLWLSWKLARWACTWISVHITGRSQVRFPMVSLDFFIDIILPVALWPWGRLIL
jgi:hypothetical protein